MRKFIGRINIYYIASFFIILLIIGFLFTGWKRITIIGPSIPAGLRNLPYYSIWSIIRVSIAYLISLIFSIIYGYAASSSKRAESFMIPILDILQSIPVLGFFPAAIHFFISLTNGDRLGVELASIFLIFTGQAWNMAFGVYESIKSIPDDLLEGAHSFGLNKWISFKKIILPATIPKLVYNSIMSWAGGWYFLIACEIIAIGPVSYELPGLGSFLIKTVEEGRFSLTIAGLLTLLSIVLLSHIFIWKPLSVWSEKFRYEFVSPFALHTESAIAGLYRDIWMIMRKGLISLRKPILFIKKGFIKIIPVKTELLIFRLMSAIKGPLFNLLRGLLKAAFIIFFVIITIKAFLGVLSSLLRPWPYETIYIPLAILCSIIRLAVAYFLALSWTLPLALWVERNPHILRIALPLSEIGASIPATALFPFIVLFVINVSGGLNLASILLVLTGMQWYLLFNLLAGIISIPADIKEAAYSLGLGKRLYWKKILIPAIFPSFVTGSITAWGGGWNALIISEYFVYKERAYSVFGIGSMLDEATYVHGDTTMLLICVISMICTIIILNRFFWRKLYDYSIEKFRLEY